MDEPAFAGCLVSNRLIGVIEAEQTERDGETMRNDRLIGVAANSRTHGDVKTLEGLNRNLLEEIEYFFISYNRIKGKEFKPLGRFGPARARRLIQASVDSFGGKHDGAKKRRNSSRAAKKKRKH